MANDKSTYTRERHTAQRRAFYEVMNTYNQIKESMGQAQALDYARITGGMGAQYSHNDHGFRLIDFVVDVESTLAKELSPSERELIAASFFGVGDADLPVKTEEIMRLMEKGGRLFNARGLYPVREYFTVIKQKVRND